MVLPILLQNFHYIPSRRAADPAPTVDSASAEIQIINRRFVIRPARDGTHEHELIELELTMVEVAFGETVGLFEVERRERFSIYD